MYKFKQVFLCFLLGTLFACEQDPLKNFPSEFREGVLKTGPQHFSNFEESLVKKLIKVDVIGKNDLSMEFSEGVLQSYRIKFRLLNNFNSKYEAQITNNPFEKLIGSKWSYDTKKQIGVLEWKPSETFTKENRSVKISIPLSIQLKKLGYPDKDSLFTVNRDITVEVNKSYIPPEVYRVQSEYDSYVKLSDDSFYRDYELSGLDLSYYDSVFLGQDKRIKVNKNFIFYTNYIYIDFGSLNGHDDEALLRVGFTKDFDLFMLTDKLGKEVSKELIPFIQEPYYQAVKKTGKVSCIKETADFLDRSVCLTHLKELTEVDVSAELYVKNYNIPAVIKSRLYYKMESPGLCEIYHDLSYDSVIHKRKWKLKPVCYLSFEHLNPKKTFVSEKTALYILRENNSFELVDKSDWEKSFYNLPEHIKWRLGGHRPVPDNTIPISLTRTEYITSLEFYLKDSNYLSDPFLIPVEQKHKILPWNIPIHWESAGAENLEENQWKLGYTINLMELFEKDQYTELYEFPLSLRPVSVNIVGKPVQLNFSVLPSVKLNLVEFFDPDVGLEVSNQFKHSGNLQEWVSAVFSIKTQVRQKYVFAPNFKENLLSVLPVNVNNQQKELTDFLKISVPEPQSSYACGEEDPFFKGQCKCSPLSYYERELINETEKSSDEEKKKEKVAFLESVCSYETSLKLNTKHINQEKQIISAYWKYDYTAPSSISLKNTFANGKDYYERPLVINNTYLSMYPSANELSEQFSFHIFFNLKPNINCFSDLDSSTKTCQIRYPLDQSPNKEDLLKLNKDKYFFSERGLQADIACLDNNSVNMKSCSCGNPQFVAKSSVPAEDEEYAEYDDFGGGYISDTLSLEIECSMDKSQKGFISAVLKTQNPYIYFLDRELKDDITSTSLKRLEIE